MYFLKFFIFSNLLILLSSNLFGYFRSNLLKINAIFYFVIVNQLFLFHQALYNKKNHRLKLLYSIESDVKKYI